MIPELVHRVAAADQHDDLFYSQAFPTVTEQLGALDTQIVALKRAFSDDDKPAITRHAGGATVLIARLASEAGALPAYPAKRAARPRKEPEATHA